MEKTVECNVDPIKIMYSKKYKQCQDSKNTLNFSHLQRMHKVVKEPVLIFERVQNKNQRVKSDLMCLLKKVLELSQRSNKGEKESGEKKYDFYTFQQVCMCIGVCMLTHQYRFVFITLHNIDDDDIKGVKYQGIILFHSY